MASLCSESGKRGVAYRVIARMPGGKRHTIRLGRVSKRIADTAHRMIESLEAAKAAGHSPDLETAEWVGRLGDEIHARLARAGLVVPREQASVTVVTLGQHLEYFFGTLGKQKLTTARNYARARRLLEQFFGKERTLESITEGDADAYKRWLLERFAPASVSVDLRRARQFLKAAVRHRLIAVNPFLEVPCGPQVNEERIEYVPAETVEAVIATCPDDDWRLIFALPRFAGGRFPSEFKNLKWSDVDWENGWFTVHESKVEHHPGRGRRVIPIFEALRPHLERAYRNRAPGAVYVVPILRHCTNVATQAKRLVTKAGFKVWPKFFTNLRGSCSDDLEQDRYGEKAIDKWIGNTARVRHKHYRGVRAEDWARATGKAARIPARPGSFTGIQEPSTLHEAREKSLDVPTDAKKDYPRQGANTAAFSTKNGSCSARAKPNLTHAKRRTGLHGAAPIVTIGTQSGCLFPGAVSLRTPVGRRRRTMFTCEHVDVC